MALARRDFLKAVGGASVAGSLVGYATPAAAAMPAALAFGFTDDNVPMNAANLCPMPSSVVTAHARYAQALDLSLSTASRAGVEALKEDARSRVAAMLGTSADEIAIVRNTSEANNTIVQGMPLAEGDEVVLWDQNHPSNDVAWEVQASRLGATVRRFSVPTDTGSIDEVVDLFVAAVGDKTKVVSFTHISNITGFRLPAAEICAAVRKRKGDIHIHVDGAQTWGAVDIDLGAIEADSFSGSAHKWFMGPREVGILYVRERHIDSIWPNVVSIPWGRTKDDAPTGARKFDALGQRDDAAVAALADTAGFHEAMTPAGIEERSMMIANRLREGLQDLNVKFVSTANPAFTSSIVILSAPRENSRQIVEQVYDNAGVQAAATGGLRMSPHVYNTADHVDRVIAAVKKSRALLS
ncbi:MAG: aminotransferase class V-fold PLP-dependent enzyme [Proteobacteria bacterium]|nr:aminotransferase class V-fold PLP-dependent enzyme [Pseudomonadota bacterium]MDA0993013.1 aminotransferase class V-fold PLP-dependent enzyme [Pseudomonadota bacterium]